MTSNDQTMATRDDPFVKRWPVDLGIDCPLMLSYTSKDIRQVSIDVPLPTGRRWENGPPLRSVCAACKTIYKASFDWGA